MICTLLLGKMEKTVFRLLIYKEEKMNRTKTYIAADWDSDKNAVQKLYDWNNNKKLDLNFHDAHEVTQARDSSLYCSIKTSLKSRMDVSKTFVLIVGNNTNSVTKGNCKYCNSYNSYTSSCAKRHPVDYKSYIDYECSKAVEANIKIIVLYKSSKVDKSKCPAVVRNIGTHVAMWIRDSDGKYYWDYNAVKKAFE